MSETSQIEVDLLLIFYNFSDQYGVVDVKSAKIWALKQLGVYIKDEPFVLTQKHLNQLMDKGATPDIRSVMATYKNPFKKP